MNNCIGCGIKLQETNESELGYTKNIKNKLCERCFRIRNYGEYKVVTKDNKEFIEILKDINKTKDLVVLVVDIFNINKNIDIIKQNIKNDIILVITKRDLLPKSTKDEKLLKYFDNYNLKIIDKIVISSYKNYNFDNLYELIKKHKKTNNVYIIGFTNAGKSTMINKIIYNYSNIENEITTSILPSTTLNTIDIKIDEELNIIDTPGILSNGSYYDILDGKELKRIIPKREIKPKTYQIKEPQHIIIDKYAIIETQNMDITLFVSNSLKITRLYKKIDTALEKNTIYVDNCDIVINGLGFIKCKGKGYVNVYTYKNISIQTRNYLI